LIKRIAHQEQAIGSERERTRAIVAPATQLAGLPGVLTAPSPGLYGAAPTASVSNEAVSRILRRCIAGSVALVGVLTTGASSARQSAFRATADMVVMYVTVRQQSGNVVTGLQASDFSLFEDGKSVPLTILSTASQPLSIAIMIDSGHSSAGWGNNRLPNALDALFSELSPGDRASVGTFGLEIAVGANLTNDRRELRRVLDEEIWLGGGTPVWQALRAACSSLASEPGRRIVLMLGDGHNTAEVAGFLGGEDAAVRFAIEHDCMVYGIDFESPLGLAGSMVKAATATGGTGIRLLASEDLVARMRALAEEWRHQYLIGFIPSARDGKVHTVEVRPNQSSYRASSRTRFMAPAGRTE
jgi:Ca-activated chloride channel family protein